MEVGRMRFMRLHRITLLFFGLAFALTCVVVMTFSASVSAAAKGKQKTFASPEDAVKALVDAVKTNTTKQLFAILGPGSEPLISSGDEVRDKASREHFIKRFEEKNSLEKQGAEKVILHVGDNDFPLPIPIVKKGATWYFDTKAGKEEILSRRIGRNELRVIEVFHAYADAQREYASKDRDGNGFLEFAQKIVSSPGKHDGLYWEAKEGGEESPFGPLFAKAAKRGYTDKGKMGVPTPYYGYFFKILKAQGNNATGGAYDYVVNGKMLLGFGLVAYPAKYGSSGIMTFIVNQEGVVYEKDLGENTAKVAESMKRYDPDKTWKKVEEKPKE